MSCVRRFCVLFTLCGGTALVGVRASAGEPPGATATVRWSGAYSVSLSDEEGSTTLCEPKAHPGEGPCRGPFEPGVLMLRLVGAEYGFDALVHVELPPGDHLLTISRGNLGAMIACLAGIGTAVLGTLLLGFGIDERDTGMLVTGAVLIPVGGLTGIVAGAVWGTDRSVRVSRQRLEAPRRATTQVGLSWNGRF